MMLGRSDPEMAKAEQLERKLAFWLGSPRKGTDHLSQYRKWLDKNGISAEENGWPSSQAYEDRHVQLFVKAARLTGAT